MSPALRQYLALYAELTDARLREDHEREDQTLAQMAEVWPTLTPLEQQEAELRTTQEEGQ